MHLATRPALRRIAAINHSIRSGKYPNATSLSRELEASPRTIQRDLEFMRDSLNAPLEFCRKTNGYRYTDETWQLPYFQLTQGELVSLFLAERVLRQYRGTPYEADLKQAFQKITASLPEQISLDLDTLGGSHSFKLSTVTVNDVQTFQKLVDAVLNRRQLRLTYWTAWRDEVTERSVDPYHLANIDGEWYLVGYCHLREEVRTFSPARIRHLKETGLDYELPPDFSITRYLDGAFRVVSDADSSLVSVRLHFTPAVAGYVREKIWHPSQVLVDTPEGGVLLTLQVGSLIEVRRWVLSFGPDCEVIEPRELRQQLREAAARLTEMYTVSPAKRSGQTPIRQERRRLSNRQARTG